MNDYFLKPHVSPSFTQPKIQPTFKEGEKSDKESCRLTSLPQRFTKTFYMTN